MSDSESSAPIIHTKLYRLVLMPDLVCRAALHQRLNEGLKLPLTLVSAPAGYGKSTLISQWLETLDEKSAWLSLEESDSSLPVFLNYFTAAVRSVFPGAFRRLATQLAKGDLPGGNLLAGDVINELDGLGKSFVLVLDDYHHIHDPEIHELIAQVLQHPPRGFHLVVVSRRSLPWETATLRANHQMSEFRVRDLQFSKSEVVDFLERNAHLPLTDHEVAQLEKGTEGWPVGLRLASMALRHRGSADELLSGMMLASGHVHTYLFNEVLSRLQPGVRSRVAEVSILNRFNAPLCKAVWGCGPASAEGVSFEELWLETGLLSIPMDGRRQWFRYHHLFQQMLQQRLSENRAPEEIARIHQRAADWLENNGEIEEALYHLLQSPDPRQAASLIVRHRNAILNHENFGRLKIWMQRLPESLIQGNPDLLLLKAWYLQSRGLYEESFVLLETIDTLLAGGASVEAGRVQALHGGLNTLRGYCAFFSGEGARALELAGQALGQLPADCQLERGEALILLMGSHQMVGSLPEGRKTVLAHLAKTSGTQPMAFQSRILAALGFADWMNADLPALERKGVEMLKLGRDAGMSESLLVGPYFQGIAAYVQNRLDEAEVTLSAVLEDGGAANAEYFAQGILAMASLHQARGEPEKANELVQRLLKSSLQTGNGSALECAQAFEAELALRQGKLAFAKKWADQYDPEPLIPFYRFHAPQLTLARIRLAEGDRGEARRLLARLEAWVRQIHNVRFLIEVLAVQASLYQQESNETGALERLGEAVALARPGNVVRVFPDSAPGLEVLFGRLALDADGILFVRRILAAFGADNLQAKEPAPPVGLIGTVSRRELEILKLMALHLTNKEIGQRLYIAPETVKKHARNLYEKLAVGSRREAVAKARGLGFL